MLTKNGLNNDFIMIGFDITLGVPCGEQAVTPGQAPGAHNAREE